MSDVSNMSRTKAMSVPMAVLGTNSDRFDFIRGNCSNPNDSEKTLSSANNNTLSEVVKSWFAGDKRDDASDDDNNDNNRAHDDYHEFSSPRYAYEHHIDVDVELAIHSRKRNQLQNHRQVHRNREEERVMKKCSFAYGPADISPNDKEYKLCDQYSNEIIDENGDEEHREYFGYQNYNNNGRIKRTWMERRYRRRLRQSQFIPPSSTVTTTTIAAADKNGDLTSTVVVGEPPPSSFHYELTPEHRHAFLAAHAALNGKMYNEQYNRNQQHVINLRHDLQLHLEEQQNVNGEEAEEVRADLTNSSLAIRGGMIRLPCDNVRLVCDEYLQPGILSIETRDVGGDYGDGTKGYEMYCNANRYGNIHGKNMMMTMSSTGDDSERMRDDFWKRHELAYVLTVDEHIYQRVAQEMGDAYQVPGGIYFCCHETGDNHVGIEVAVLLLLLIFVLYIAGMIAWPSS